MTLLPCPFCGDADIDPHFSYHEEALEDGSKGPKYGFEPGCMKCGATAPAEVWNKRQALDRDAVLEMAAKVCDEGVKWEPNFPPNIQRVSTETAYLLGKAIRALKREPSADPQGQSQAGQLAPPAPAVSAPDVAEMVKRLRHWQSSVDGTLCEIAADELERQAALLARLGQGWVTVSERLPDEGEYVWCAGKHDLQVTSKFSAGRFYGYVESVECWEYDLTDKVTHWMPLPPLPKSSDE